MSIAQQTESVGDDLAIPQDGTPVITVAPDRPGHFLIQTALWLPQRREEIFPFFGDALNLEAITPPWLHFQVLTPSPIEMRPGTLIDYKLRLHGIPIRWRTLISRWEPPISFVDEQLLGPYRTWHHEHRFEPYHGGTLCTDRVHYRVWGGRLIDWLLVRRDLLTIFNYRSQVLKQRFAGADRG